MKRRRRIQGLSAALFALGLAIVYSSGCARDARPPSPVTPVILISVDTLRADHLPAYGYRNVQTPNIDALRRDSILFANAYSHVPLTLPSHASILTGLVPSENGVRDNYGYSVSEKTQTLAALLKSNGYATGAAVSAFVLARGTGIERGFDFYDDDVRQGGREERDGARTAEALEGWLRGRRAGPFFAFLHIFEPHAPWEPPEPWRTRFTLPYDGEIARADEIVGLWIAKLKQWGHYDRALVILLSDHGEGLGDHGEREHGVFLYREAIHVPLLVKLPRGRRAGDTVTAVVALTDVFPTVVEVARVSPPAGLPGLSLLGRIPAARSIVSETFYPRLRLGWSDLTSLVDARNHYIEAPRPELYDLNADPGEKRDLAPALSRAFRSMRLELSRRTRPFHAPSADENPERARRLASLGYLTATSPDASAARLPDPKDQIALLYTEDLGKLVSKGNDPDLIAASRAFLGRVPGSLDAWRLLADALERRGARSEAIAALEKGLRASEATAHPRAQNAALERLAVLLVRDGRRDEALKVASAVTFTDPESLNTIGVAWGEAGNALEARRAFEKAIAADPASPAARFNMGMALFRDGDVAGGRRHLEEAVRVEPGWAEAWEALGQARAETSDAAGARLAWQRAIEIDPRRYRALFNLGIAAGKSGDLAGARAALTRFLAGASAREFPGEIVEARRLLAGIRKSG